MPARVVLRAVLTEVDRNSIDPGRELRVSPKLIDGLEDLNEHFLREILGLFSPAEHAEDECEDAAFVRDDEQIERAFVAGDEPRYELRFVVFDPGQPWESFRRPPYGKPRSTGRIPFGDDDRCLLEPFARVSEGRARTHCSRVRPG